VVRRHLQLWVIIGLAEYTLGLHPALSGYFPAKPQRLRFRYRQRGFHAAKYVNK
jgi:hypothetical protein